MTQLKNLRIIANAGSGKTTRLTARFIELLGRGVPAEKIIALTFTRKAAGEFLDRIFQRLLQGAESDAGARELSRRTGVEFTREACLGHLREMISKLPRVALGTLDGFFGRIIQAFPFECGLAGELTIIDEHFQTRTRREVLTELFRRQASSPERFEEFLDLLRRQSRNIRQRGVTDILDRTVAGLHERFLLTPADLPWGDPASIWSKRPAILEERNLAALLGEFSSRLYTQHPDIEEKHRAGWEKLFDEIRLMGPGDPATENGIKFALKLLSPAPSKRAGHLVLKLGNKQFEFPDAVRPLCTDFGYAILRAEVVSRLDRSRALHELLGQFEEAYHQGVRDAGRLTFLDVTGLLAAAGNGTWGGRSLQRIDRRAIDYRLDAAYDHWLLDEFQDTSRLQWNALRDLVDEVLQSDSGRRSFFYVGDTKQAIYGWRGGDPRLFTEIADFYNNADEPRIDTGEELATSYRSVPEIIDWVNEVFSPKNLIASSSDMELPEQTLDRWEHAWRDHKSHGMETGQGCVEWRCITPGSEESKTEALNRETAELLAGIDPIRNGWSCAVLVRSNDRAASVVNALRAKGLAASSEGRFSPCTDNDLGTALMAALRTMAHPADTLSPRHVAMTPLAPLLAESPAAFRETALRSLAERGFAATAQSWLAGVPLNSFAKNRADSFAEVAAEFDETFGGRAGIDDFLSFAENYTTSDNPDTRTIRVMTIHGSKGLDFDIVVLPDLEGASLPSRKDSQSVFLRRDEGGEVLWGLDLPKKDVCLADPTLREAYEQDAADDCYENLCVYYVAMTRARRGLHLITTRLKEDTSSKDFNRLLHDTFGREEDSIVRGNTGWHLAGKPREAEPEVPIISKITLADPAQEKSSPSFAHGIVDAGGFFTGPEARLFGTDIHRALAEVSWFGEEFDFDAYPRDVAETISEFLGTPAAEKIFARPDLPHTLWREREFDVLSEGSRITGRFDRVVLLMDEEGDLASAQIIDFKTDEVLSAERHRPQMESYRAALAVLTGLKPEAISTTIAGVRTGGEISIF
jgi:ATP-dependent exoDNAse (exonuclease V) beta subunit